MFFTGAINLDAYTLSTYGLARTPRTCGTCTIKGVTRRRPSLIASMDTRSRRRIATDDAHARNAAIRRHGSFSAANAGRRFQCDPQWQRNFLALAEARAEQCEHVAAGCQLRDAGVYDESRAELALADELQERIEILLHALNDLR